MKTHTRILGALTLLALGPFFLPSYSSANKSTCVAPKESFPVKHNGYYHRMHPSGNYFIYTDTNRSFVVDISNRAQPVTYKSKMREEAYPVEAAKGGWELIAAPIDGGGRGPKGGMQYYRFGDLTSSKSGSAAPTYEDREHGEYYLSSAELPASTSQTKRVRTLLFSERHYREYDFEMSKDGSIAKSKAGPIKRLCENLFGAKQRPQITPQQEEALSRLRQEFGSLVRGGGATKVNVEAARAKAEEIFNLQREVYAHLGEQFATLNKQRNLALIDLVGAQAAVQEFRPYQDAMKQLREAQVNYDRRRQDISRPIYEAQRVRLREIETAYRAERRESERGRLAQEYTRVQNEVEQAINQSFNSDPEARRLQATLTAADKLRVELEKVGPVKVMRELVSQIGQLEEDASDLTARNLINPILSKDGTHVAGLVGRRLNVFKINDDGTCEVVLKTKHRASKVSFSYPKQGENLKVAFTTEGTAPKYEQTAYVMDTKTGRSEIISDSGDGPSYPGFLLDGRVMYRSSNGMTIVDPEAKQGRQCIAIDSIAPRSGGEGRTTK